MRYSKEYYQFGARLEGAAHRVASSEPDRSQIVKGAFLIGGGHRATVITKSPTFGQTLEKITQHSSLNEIEEQIVKAQKMLEALVASARRKQ